MEESFWITYRMYRITIPWISSGRKCRWKPGPASCLRKTGSPPAVDVLVRNPHLCLRFVDPQYEKPQGKQIKMEQRYFQYIIRPCVTSLSTKNNLFIACKLNLGEFLNSFNLCNTILNLTPLTCNLRLMFMTSLSNPFMSLCKEVQNWSMLASLSVTALSMMLCNELIQGCNVVKTTRSSGGAGIEYMLIRLYIWHTVSCSFSNTVIW